MSDFYCFRADCECELDINEAYNQGRIDAIDEFTNKIIDEYPFLQISKIRNIAEQIKGEKIYE